MMEGNMWFVYHRELTGRVRNSSKPECRMRTVDGVNYLRFTWNNVRGYATKEQKRLFQQFRVVAVKMILDRLKSQKLYVDEIGTAVRKSNVSSDVDVNVGRIKCHATKPECSISMKDIFDAMLSGTGRRTNISKIVHVLDETFDMNIYPILETPRGSDASKDTSTSYGDSRFRLVKSAIQYGLSDVFARTGTEEILKSGPTSCTKTPDVDQIGKPNGHCRYASQLNEAYMGYGAFIHIVLQIKNARNPYWYLLSMVDNLGFMVETLFKNALPCYSTSINARLIKMAKYIGRMADAVLLLEKGIESEYASSLDDMEKLKKYAFAAKVSGAKGNSVPMARFYKHLKVMAATTSHSKRHLHVPEEIDRKEGMTLRTNWLTLVLLSFHDYITMVIERYK